jgi:hypothetical protein
MPTPTPLPIRQAIARRFQQGQTAAQIAQALHLPPRTVRQLLQRLRHQPTQDLAPSYRRTSPPQAGAQHPLYPDVVGLRQLHPTWGAGLLRVMLRQTFPQRDLPCPRTLQRWLQQAGLAPAPTGRRPHSQAARARQPHAVWQVDACERIPLRAGQRASWLRIIDECSGAILWTKVFPPGRVAEGTPGSGATATPGRLRPLGAAGDFALR